MTAKGENLLEHLASKHIKELLKREPLLAESLKRLKQLPGIVAQTHQAPI